MWAAGLEPALRPWRGRVQPVTLHPRGPCLAARAARPSRSARAVRTRVDREPGGGRHSRRRVPDRFPDPPCRTNADRGPRSGSSGTAGFTGDPLLSGPSRSGESNPVLLVGGQPPYRFGFCGVGVSRPSGRIRTCDLLLPRQTGWPSCPTLGRVARPPPRARRPRGPTGNRTLNSCLQGRCDPVSPSARVPVAAVRQVRPTGPAARPPWRTAPHCSRVS